MMQSHTVVLPLAVPPATPASSAKIGSTNLKAGALPAYASCELHMRMPCSHESSQTPHEAACCQLSYVASMMKLCSSFQFHAPEAHGKCAGTEPHLSFVVQYITYEEGHSTTKVCPGPGWRQRSMVVKGASRTGRWSFDLKPHISSDFRCRAIVVKHRSTRWRSVGSAVTSAAYDMTAYAFNMAADASTHEFSFNHTVPKPSEPC